MKPILVKKILKADEQKNLAFNRKFRRVTGDLSLSKPWSYYKDKVSVFINGKSNDMHAFSSFYCFKERDYSELNIILNRINSKIIKHRGEFGRGEKLDKVEEIMRGVIYEVNKNEDSDCYQANHLYKKLVKKYVKNIFEYYKDKPFNPDECARLWLEAHRELVSNTELSKFDNLIKGSYLTFNSAFQYIFDYGYFKRYTQSTAEEYSNFIFNAYALISNNEFPYYRNTNAHLQNDGSWMAVEASQIRESVDILLDWFINDKDSIKLNPIEKACIMHCEMVRIQAFPDANHRLARLIANEILVESDFPCVGINFDIRKEYEEATNEAIQDHDIDNLIDIYYDQVYRNALKIDKCLDELDKKEAISAEKKNKEEKQLEK